MDVYGRCIYRIQFSTEFYTLWFFSGMNDGMMVQMMRRMHGKPTWFSFGLAKNYAARCGWTCRLLKCFINFHRNKYGGFSSLAMMSDGSIARFIDCLSFLTCCFSASGGRMRNIVLFVEVILGWFGFENHLNISQQWHHVWFVHHCNWAVFKTLVGWWLVRRKFSWGTSDLRTIVMVSIPTIMSTTPHQVVGKSDISEACEFTGENILLRETLCFPGNL